MFRALRPVLLLLVVAIPAVALRLTGTHPPALASILVFGLAVVAASFVLAWAAEAAEVDISGGLAIALLAVIAVLPEYAVDLYFAHTAGSNPDYVQFAAANMTGSNRLLLGLGWSSVVLVSLYVASRRSGQPHVTEHHFGDIGRGEVRLKALRVALEHLAAELKEGVRKGTVGAAAD